MTFDDIVSTDPIELRYVNSGDLLQDAKAIIETSREAAYTSVNFALVIRNWLLGKRISEDDLGGNRAEYGTETIKLLAKELKKEYGTGFDLSNLYRFIKFYECYPNIFDAPCRKSRILSWTYYRIHQNDRYRGEQVMNKYSRILIEQYCRTHKRTKKSSLLSNLLKLSYTMDREPADWEALELAQYIDREKDPKLRDALIDLDEFLFG